ncbi:MAG TPA: metallophosphoesterase [Myxococcaceae bacterium]|nr:metallophosphoesterase [Myxococcaceae bacterium]
MLRIAHVSDTHVLSMREIEWRKILFNKRITGQANTFLRRGRVHRREYLLAVLAAATAAADHVVVTGDITNLALETEYQEARALLECVARSIEVTVVPGNHDIYLPSIHRERRFPHHFRSFLRSDLPDLALDLPAGPFPCVKLRGPVAIIGLSSGVPRPPFVAAGYLGHAQRRALARVLAHREVAQRTPVILVHHPPVDSRSRLAQLRDGLVDAALLRDTLAPLGRGLVLFGHLHVRVRCVIRTDTGTLEVVGASGAALDHPDPAVRAGFNLYQVGDDGRILTIEAHVLDGTGTVLQLADIPQRAACV